MKNTSTFSLDFTKRSQAYRLLYFANFLMFAKEPSRGSHKKNLKKKIDEISQKKHKILIVDDEERFREAMRFNLTEIYGAEVKDVESGDEAIADLKSGSLYDVIFLDIMMPGKNGLVTYNEMKAMQVDCPIVMMSAYADSPEWEQAKKFDVDLMPKPVRSEHLVNILSKLGK